MHRHTPFLLLLLVASSPANSAAQVRPARTGQTTCYSETGVVVSCAHSGQDAGKQAGVAWPSPRFTDNKNGTVTDNLTGLIWLGDADCRDTVGGVAREDGPLIWPSALVWSNYLASGSCGLSDGSVPGDWRLPNINELRSLIDYSRHDPALSSDHPFSNVRSEWYWSSTSNPAYTAAAYTVGMSRGSIDVTSKRGEAPTRGEDRVDTRVGRLRGVWPVRGGGTTARMEKTPGLLLGLPLALSPGREAAAGKLPRTGQTTCYSESGAVIPCANTGQDGEKQGGVPWPTPRFTDNRNGTVTDALTGLIWLKDANCRDPVGGIARTDGLLDWPSAITWSNTLASGHCGLSDGSVAQDWRLPDINELRSLLDYSRYNETPSNNLQFLNVQSEPYWSSTSNPAYTAAAYSVSLCRDSMSTPPKAGSPAALDGSRVVPKTGRPLGVWPVRDRK